MDPILNPFAPGAGTPPPTLTGRAEIRETVRVCIERERRGRPAQSVVIFGMRGAGKTVLLNQMRQDAEASGAHTIRIETQQHRSLPGLLALPLKQTLLQLSKVEAAKALAIRALRALTGFTRVLRLKYHDIEISLDFDPEPGLADNGDLESDLVTLFEQVGMAARAAGTVLAIFIDELQDMELPQLVALLGALNLCAQRRLPVVLIVAGLPLVRARLRTAKSYAERMFVIRKVGALSTVEARQAIVGPATDEGLEINDDAVDKIVREAGGYPYLLQEWGKHTWNMAAQSPITVQDVTDAAPHVIAALDESFFRARLDQMTHAEKCFLRAMAALGAGPHRLADIACELGDTPQSLLATHSGLIEKGMIWCDVYDDATFTVPLFDAFMKRIMPGDTWRAKRVAESA